MADRSNPHVNDGENLVDAEHESQRSAHRSERVWRVERSNGAEQANLPDATRNARAAHSRVRSAARRAKNGERVELERCGQVEHVSGPVDDVTPFLKIRIPNPWPIRNDDTQAKVGGDVAIERELTFDA